MIMSRLLLFAGAVSAFLSVALGAFGAHALKSHLSADMMTVYQTGVHYQQMHSLALILLAVLGQQPGLKIATHRSGIFMLAGIMIFSGSLYALSLSGIRAFGAITPLGGVCLLVAWALLAISALRAR